MLCDFKRSTESVGLGIHPDKTNILSNQEKVKEREITIDNIKIEVIQKSDSARYIGQKITFEEQETAEVKNRLQATWAFHKYRQELTSKAYRLCHRLRLFNVVITPTMTHASGTWTLSQTHEKHDQDRTTEDASPHRPDDKKIQIEEQKGNKRDVSKKNGNTRRK